MENVKELAPMQTAVEEFDQHYQNQSDRQASEDRNEKKQSKLSKLFHFLTNLDSGFPLSGA